MSSIINKFWELIDTAVDSNRNHDAHSPIKSTSGVPSSLVGVKLGLNFTNIPDKEELVGIDENTMTSRILGWLIEAASTLIKKVIVHANFLKVQQNVVASKADSKEVMRLQEQLAKVEQNCDEARQRGMKGNLILSSPTNRSTTLFKPMSNLVEGTMVKESMVEMCIRAIETKTGIRVPLEDVSACHPLQRRGTEPNTTFVIRIWNRREGSAWEKLTAGLMTGRQPGGSNFTNANLFINYQLTPMRGDLVKAVRTAKVARRLHKYSVDANGRCFVQLDNRGSPWKEVTSKDSLETMLSQRSRRQ